MRRQEHLCALPLRSVFGWVPAVFPVEAVVVILVLGNVVANESYYQRELEDEVLLGTVVQVDRRVGVPLLFEGLEHGVLLRWGLIIGVVDVAICFAKNPSGEILGFQKAKI